jgi:hypothetical protein
MATPKTITDFIQNSGTPTAPGQPGSGPSLAEKYPDTWRTIAEQLQGGRGPANLWTNILGNFRGGQDMTDFLNWAAPFMAGSIFNTEGYKYQADPANWDQSMQAYGAGAGQIGQAGTQALSQGSNQLARMGLGRSGAMASLAGQTALQTGVGQGNLYTNLYQQGVQNRLNAARGAIDADRSIASLALGLTPQRAPKQDHSALAGAIGSAVGTIGGGLIGSFLGPAGAVVGAGAGGALGGGASSDLYG